MHEILYRTRQVGNKYTKKYSMFLHGMSFWHDIPLVNDKKGTFNFVCEIPKNTRAKMEVMTSLEGTPIKQDLDSNGALRFYDSPIPWNYGMLPRTYEDPKHTSWAGMQGLPGDGDPLDVIEVSKGKCEIGGVYKVKILGALALIDEGEVDWKILAVRCDSQDEDNVYNDIDDLKKTGVLDEIMIWFRDYKIKKGKPQNSYGLEPQNSAYAKNVIMMAHKMYLNTDK